MSDCRTESGITIGLIDSLISIARVLAPRLASASESSIAEALADLNGDTDIKTILDHAKAAGASYRPINNS